MKFVFTFTKDQDASEEIVQNLFVKLWENRQSLQINTSLRSYLLKIAQNTSLDWIRHSKIIERHRLFTLDNAILMENDIENYIFQSELEQILEHAVNDLPNGILEVFKMSRIEGLKYYEIAEKLNVSVRTVEDRIHKALILLRKKLKDYMVLFISAIII